jgi:hypothetical protein
MKIVLSVLVGSVISVAAPLTAMAQTMDHTIVSPQDIKWGKGPPSIPPGAESAVLYGDLAKEGMFAFRLKLPKGYRIPPHTHPKPEIVTVISGTFRLGHGRSFRSEQGPGLARGQLLRDGPRDGAHCIR